jgi:hypothetical protein
MQELSAISILAGSFINIDKKTMFAQAIDIKEEEIKIIKKVVIMKCSW